MTLAIYAAITIVVWAALIRMIGQQNIKAKRVVKSDGLAVLAVVGILVGLIAALWPIWLPVLAILVAFGYLVRLLMPKPAPVNKDWEEFPE